MYDSMQVIYCTIVWKGMQKFYQIMMTDSSEQKFDFKYSWKISH